MSAPPNRVGGLYGGNIRAVVERGLKVMAGQNWLVMVSGFFEPVLYLLAMGYGLGGLVGDVDFDAAREVAAGHAAPGAPFERVLQAPMAWGERAPPTPRTAAPRRCPDRRASGIPGTR